MRLLVWLACLLVCVGLVSAGSFDDLTPPPVNPPSMIPTNTNDTYTTTTYTNHTNTTQNTTIYLPLANANNQQNAVVAQPANTQQQAGVTQAQLDDLTNQIKSLQQQLLAKPEQQTPAPVQTPSWVLPAVIGAASLAVLQLIIIAVLVIAVTRKQQTPTMPQQQMLIQIPEQVPLVELKPRLDQDKLLQAKAYVRQLRNKGVHDEDILYQLHEAGWPGEYVREALK